MYLKSIKHNAPKHTHTFAWLFTQINMVPIHIHNLKLSSIMNITCVIIITTGPLLFTFAFGWLCGICFLTKMSIYSAHLAASPSKFFFFFILSLSDQIFLFLSLSIFCFSCHQHKIGCLLAGGPNLAWDQPFDRGGWSWLLTCIRQWDEGVTDSGAPLKSLDVPTDSSSCVLLAHRESSRFSRLATPGLELHQKH